ncbi:MAG: F0F1 ATP synthase subunit A [Sarcina sp.]
MNVFAPLYTLNIFGIKVDSWIVTQWGVMIFLIIVGLILGVKFKKKNSKEYPSKLQVVIEMIYEAVGGMVNENLGDKFRGYVPFVGTLFVYLWILNLCGLIGFGPPTRNLSTVIGFTVITFVLVHYNAIKGKGFGKYLKGYTEPYVLMLPINIIEKIVFPVSLCLRLFGNMLAAAIVMSLIYMGLGGISTLAQFGVPIIPHAFFDLFDGTIQTIIFVMLTVITIKLESQTEEF